MTSTTRTFRHPSTATLAPLKGRPIAITWLGAPDQDLLKVPREVELTATYSGVALDDGRIILTPTGAPLERADADAEPSKSKARVASKRARGAPAPTAEKPSRAAPAKARGRSSTSPRRPRTRG